MTEPAPYTLEVTPLSAAAFAPFGHVIGGEGRVEPRSDPRTTVPFSQWGETPIATKDGVPLALDIVSRTVTPPLEVTRLYRHHTAPQVLASLGGTRTSSSSRRRARPSRTPPTSSACGPSSRTAPPRSRSASASGTRAPTR